METGTSAVKLSEPSGRPQRQSPHVRIIRNAKELRGQGRWFARDVMPASRP
jgi:hypothetical protein